MQWQSPSPCECPLYSRHLTQHFWKGFLELRTRKVFLLQGFSKKILLLCSEPEKKKQRYPASQRTGEGTGSERFPQRKGSGVCSRRSKGKGNVHGNPWMLLEKALSSCVENIWRLFVETPLSHEQGYCKNEVFKRAG